MAAAAAAAGHGHRPKEGKGAEPDQRNTACIQPQRKEGRKERRKDSTSLWNIFPNGMLLRLKPHFRCNEREGESESEAWRGQSFRGENMTAKRRSS